MIEKAQETQERDEKSATKSVKSRKEPSTTRVADICVLRSTRKLTDFKPFNLTPCKSTTPVSGISPGPVVPRTALHEIGQ